MADSARSQAWRAVDVDRSAADAGVITSTARAMSSLSAGAYLVIVGPDGDGKTTPARASINRLGRRGRYFHLIPNPLNSLEPSPPEDPLRVEKSREVRCGEIPSAAGTHPRQSRALSAALEQAYSWAVDSGGIDGLTEDLNGS